MCSSDLIANSAWGASLARDYNDRSRLFAWAIPVAIVGAAWLNLAPAVTKGKFGPGNFNDVPIIGWIVIGLIAGWLAGKIARGASYGCITDIILGLVGSVLGGWLFMKLGILGGGFLYSLAAATVGAIILVSIVHLFVGNRS